MKAAMIKGITRPSLDNDIDSANLGYIYLLISDRPFFTSPWTDVDWRSL